MSKVKKSVYVLLKIPKDTQDPDQIRQLATAQFTMFASRLCPGNVEPQLRSVVLDRYKTERVVLYEGACPERYADYAGYFEQWRRQVSYEVTSTWIGSTFWFTHAAELLTLRVRNLYDELHLYQKSEYCEALRPDSENTREFRRELTQALECMLEVLETQEEKCIPFLPYRHGLSFAVYPAIDIREGESKDDDAILELVY